MKNKLIYVQFLLYIPFLDGKVIPLTLQSSVCKVANRNHTEPAARRPPATSRAPTTRASSAPRTRTTRSAASAGAAPSPSCRSPRTPAVPGVPTARARRTGSSSPSPRVPPASRGCRGCPLSMPSMVASRLKVAKQFTICLPDGGQPGAAVSGGGTSKAAATSNQLIQVQTRADRAHGHVPTLV
jgi:hypothetical protein